MLTGHARGLTPSTERGRRPPRQRSTNGGGIIYTVFIPIINAQGWSRDLGNGLYGGKSSTYSALQIGMWAGYPRVYIIGCDMAPVGDRTWHYGGDNPDITIEQRIPRFDLEAAHWKHAAKALRPEERSKIYFCSGYNRFAFVDAFNRRDHRGIVGEILAGF